ncbi:MAG: hypothetical protein WC494_01605 [Candidatus Pacearchaeota archaeon]
MITKIRSEEVYRHFKGEEKLYKVLGVARCKIIRQSDLKNLELICHAKDCENPDEEFDVFREILEEINSANVKFWINGKDKITYVVYQQLYSSEDFPKNTIWMRSIRDFTGYKNLEEGRRVKRFELVKDLSLVTNI